MEAHSFIHVHSFPGCPGRARQDPRTVIKRGFDWIHLSSNLNAAGRGGSVWPPAPGTGAGGWAMEGEQMEGLGGGGVDAGRRGTDLGETTHVGRVPGVAWRPAGA